MFAFGKNIFGKKYCFLVLTKIYLDKKNCFKECYLKLYIDGNQTVLEFTKSRRTGLKTVI